MVGNATKKRLDVLLVERGLAPTRSKAQALIMSGIVRVNGELRDKPGGQVNIDAQVEVLEKGCPYVSRGGLKLKKAIDYFSIGVKGKKCIDVGASTGGFTHCLLLEGAEMVVAIDVGYGQLDWKLRQDPRVLVVERTNFRYFDPSLLPFPKADIIVIDVSFISLKLILPVAQRLLGEKGSIVALIKPQFEVGPQHVGKGGIVRDGRLHRQVIENIKKFSEESLRLRVLGYIESPILGAKGNREFLIALTH